MIFFREEHMSRRKKLCRVIGKKGGGLKETYGDKFLFSNLVPHLITRSEKITLPPLLSAFFKTSTMMRNPGQVLAFHIVAYFWSFEASY